VIPHTTIFRLRQKSLARGVLLALGAMAASLRLAGFPDSDAPHSSHWQILAVPMASWGMVETARCLARKWSLYHAGVLILLYSELMILALVLFLWLYP
jgi:CO dehydrogenase/acetyl-CoA synthase gamma subunit (corrinoid Fe-S protein)